MLTKSFLFFSPRAKHGRAYALRALGLLLADNALTVGRLFDVSTGFFLKTASTPERKVGKWLPRWEMNNLSEGYN